MVWYREGAEVAGQDAEVGDQHAAKDLLVAVLERGGEAGAGELFLLVVHGSTQNVQLPPLGTQKVGGGGKKKKKDEKR